LGYWQLDQQKPLLLDLCELLYEEKMGRLGITGAKFLNALMLRARVALC
jgi:hypothetical protein